VDGVSLTYGPSGSRQHIWTFVAALDSQTTGISYCPRSSSEVPNSFVNNDYFCDSANDGTSLTSYQIYPDPLWDGSPCLHDLEMPNRCTVNNPPWFTKGLNASTTENIELRICGFSDSRYYSTLLQEVEIYIK